MRTHLLFVDDEASNLSIYHSAFHRNYEVHLAESGFQALEILKAFPIQLIVTDQRMPGMTGIDLLKEVATRYSGIECIIATAYGDLSVMLKAINEQHVFQYLLKPVDLSQLRIAIDNALSKLRLERENKALLKQLEEANQGLEIKVDERTRELRMKNSILLLISQEVNAKNEKITQSLNYAKKLQQAILPSQSGLHRILPESFVFQHPKDIVSGDFFWYKQLAPHTYMLALADCTGHGIPGAFMTILGSICLDLVYEQQVGEGSYSPANILYALDRQLQSVLNGEDADSMSQDGMDAIIAVIDCEKKEIVYSSARSIAYLTTSEGIQELPHSRYGIGFQPKVKEKVFINHKASFSPKDMLFFASDGFQDQFSAHKIKLRRKNFVKILEDISKESIYEQAIVLKQTFQAWKGDTAQTDDVLVIGIRL